MRGHRWCCSGQAKPIFRGLPAGTVRQAGAAFSLLRFFDFADCGFHSSGPDTPRLFFHVGIGAHRQPPSPSLLWWQFRPPSFFLFSRSLHTVLMYTINVRLGRYFCTPLLHKPRSIQSKLRRKMPVIASRLSAQAASSENFAEAKMPLFHVDAVDVNL